MKDETKTIESVVIDGLCTGCGTCVGICPADALEMLINHKKGIYIPRLDKEKCNQCGLCYDVCPGHSVDFKQLNQAIFGKEPEDILLGNYLNCYTGHAIDYDIRYNSSSGGLVTALLIFALEEGLIDGALVTKMREDRPLEPQPFIACTKEEIISAAKSKYCPVPANIALKEILKAKEGEKFAVVGLPCHIHGIRKAEIISKKLKERIVLHLGILCGYAPTLLGTEFLIWKGNAKKEDISKISYRGAGWPGGIAIQFKNGKSLYYTYNYVWTNIFGRFFYPVRCTLCCDQSCELADISCGDAWLPGLVADDSIGTSIVVSRSKLGQLFLEKVISKGNVALSKISVDMVKRSQNEFSFKKSLNARIELLKLFRHRVPTYIVELPRPKFRVALLTPLLYFDSYFSTKRYFWKFLYYYISLRSLIVGLIIRIKRV